MTVRRAERRRGVADITMVIDTPERPQAAEPAAGHHPAHRQPSGGWGRVACVIGDLQRWLAAHLKDIGCVLFLLLVASHLFFSRAGAIPLAQDSFRKAYLIFADRLPPLITDYQPYLGKYAGRPLRALPWHLAQLTGGGSVAGYNAFMFGCLTLTSIMIYLLLRVLAPGHRALALGAAAVKLVWTANHDVFANNTLTNSFGELAFWVATYLLAVLLRRTHGLLLSARLLLSALMALALVVSTASYETGWLVTLFCPLALLYLLRLFRRRPATLSALGVWYAACSAAVGWWVLNYWLFPQVRSPSFQAGTQRTDLATFGARLLTGLQATLLDPLLVPLNEAVSLLSGARGQALAGRSYSDPWLILVFVLFFVVLYTWTRHRPEPEQPASQQDPDHAGSGGRATAVRLVLCGLIVVLLGLGPPSFRYDPVYGTRFLQWASLGGIMVMMAPAVWATGQLKASGSLLAGLWLTTLFGASALYLDQLGASRARGEHVTRVWQELITAVPSVAEDTVVVVEDCPFRSPQFDAFGTFAFRGLSGTKRSFLACEVSPVLVPNDSGYAVRVSTSVNLARPDHSPTSHLTFPPFAPGRERQEVLIEQERVLWLKWNSPSRSFEIVESRSSMSRLRADQRSELGRRLFPDTGREP